MTFRIGLHLAFSATVRARELEPEVSTKHHKLRFVPDVHRHRIGRQECRADSKELIRPAGLFFGGPFDGVQLHVW